MAMGLCTIHGAAFAAKFDQTSVKSNPRTIFRSAMPIGDNGHEAGVEMTRSDMKFTDPAFGTAEENVYNQFDYLNGSGPHRGTFIDTYPDGSMTYGTYEGMQKTVANADGSWVATWEGRYRYVGGAGKFANIRGSGTYKGRAASNGEYMEEAKETGEY
jgi:hypothetical protein